MQGIDERCVDLLEEQSLCIDRADEFDNASGEEVQFGEVRGRQNVVGHYGNAIVFPDKEEQMG